MNINHNLEIKADDVNKIADALYDKMSKAPPIRVEVVHVVDKNTNRTINQLGNKFGESIDPLVIAGSIACIGIAGAVTYGIVKHYHRSSSESQCSDSGSSVSKALCAGLFR